MIACSLLQRAGFRNVINLTGGFDAWQQATLPVATEKPVECDEVNGKRSVQELKTKKLAQSYRIDSGKHFQLKTSIRRTPDTCVQRNMPRSAATGIAETAELQDKLYAQDHWSLLLIFQAMDAAGKDGASSMSCPG